MSARRRWRVMPAVAVGSVDGDGPCRRSTGVPTMSIASETITEPKGFAPAALIDFAGAQPRNAASLTQAGEIMSQTATAIWQRQKEFLQHEAVEAAKGFGAFG